MPDRRHPSRFAPPAGRIETETLVPFLRRFALLGAAIALLLALGTAGFTLTEGTSLWRSFVWTLDTIATVGSIPDPEDQGAQVIKVALIALGVGTLFYALVTVTEFLVAGHLTGLLHERRTLRRIASMSGHHLICGFGRVGRQAGRDLRDAGEEFVVIDVNPSKRESAEELGGPFIEGEAADDERLREAGIARARSLIACVDSDAENIFVTLTARELHPDIYIVARASQEASEKKLFRAGANRVLSPYKSSGAEMARLALHPQVPVAVDVAPRFRMEEIEVSADCSAAGSTISAVRGDATVIAVRHPDGTVEPEPGAERTLRGGDVLVVMGSGDALDRLERAFEPAPTSG